MPSETNRVSLVVLAAGMGSRYGGLKQMDAFGPNGESIIDYSIYDAMRAGFNHIVFIIREYFGDEFKATWDKKLKGKVAVDYVFQELHKLPIDFDIPAEREKPWGTGHAVWVAHEVVDGPFGVINADDYYGPESYKTLFDFLVANREHEEYCVVGYKLDNTLSEHGAVNRGVCKADSFHFLEGIVECKQIIRGDDGIITYPSDDGRPLILEPETPVSMNMWGFFPSYFDYFVREFTAFLNAEGQALKSEYYIPSLVDSLIQSRERRTRVLETNDEWFGVTYKEDKDFVRAKLEILITKEVYPDRLW